MPVNPLCDEYKVTEEISSKNKNINSKNLLMKEKLKTMKLSNYLCKVKQDVAIFALLGILSLKHSQHYTSKILVCLLLYWIYCPEKALTIKKINFQDSNVSFLENSHPTNSKI